MLPRSLLLVQIAVAKAHPADSRPAVIAMDVIQAICHIDGGFKVQPIAQDLSERTSKLQQKANQHPLTVPKGVVWIPFWEWLLLFQLPHLRSKKVCGVLPAAANKWFKSEPGLDMKLKPPNYTRVPA